MKKRLYATIRSLSPIWAWFFSLNACQDEKPVFNNSDRPIINTQNYGDLFKYTWEGLDKNYAFWDIDPTDWDEVYREFFPKFQRLSTGMKDGQLDSKNLEQAKGFFKQSMNKLIDGHLRLSGLDGWEFFPLKAKRGPGDYPPFSPEYFWPESKSKSEYGISRFLKVKWFDDSKCEDYKRGMLLGEKEENGEKIIYFTFREFDLEKIYEGSKCHSEHAKSLLDKFFSMIQGTSYKGLILDLRSNDGGILDDMDFFVSRLVQSPYIAAYSRVKNGPNRYDYSPWTPFKIFPHNQKAVDFPIVILVDRYSMSLAETTALILSSQPNVTVVGDTTFGAFGPIVNDTAAAPKNLNWNNFTIGKGPLSIRVRGAIASTKSPDGKRYEGKGFTPEVLLKIDLSGRVDYDKDKKIKGMKRDNQFDRAVEIILDKS